MKKGAFIMQILVVAVLCSSTAFADDDWDEGYGYGRPRCNRHQWGGGYPRQQVNNYYPQPQQNYYYQQPPVVYYEPQPYYQPQPQPQYNNGGGYNDNRSHQGLAGSVIGDVIGYELGNGNPIAAGIGAAAGSFLGNGAAFRY